MALYRGREAYSPAKCIGTERQDISAGPDPKHASASYVQCQNLAMACACFARLTCAHPPVAPHHCRDGVTRDGSAMVDNLARDWTKHSLAASGRRLWAASGDSDDVLAGFCY
jgi:hypothetical protein